MSTADIVVAKLDEAGNPVFATPENPFVVDVPGVVSGGFYWVNESIAQLPADVGAEPTSPLFPGPGGILVGVLTFPPSAADSDGPRDGAGVVQSKANQPNPALHQTNTIDYIVVLSGKVDVELGNGATRTLTAGSILIMGGITHAWSNHYDEPCTYLAILNGAHPAR